ncbi:MAG: hypothetical protein Q7T21_02840 [Gallionella sp.]|nr:hypothetical protein [Gallionella sp.]
MTLIAAMMQAFLAAYMIGLGVGVVTISLVRLVKWITGPGNIE